MEGCRMNYQISNVGVGIILAYSALVLLFVIWPLAGMLRKLRWKWEVLGPVALVLLAAPWAEEYWIAKNFYEACQNAGVHVYKKVEVEGFVDDTSRCDRDGIKPGYWNFDGKSLADWDSRGYRFQENMLKDGGVVHLERTSQGLEASLLDHPTARYHYKHAYQPTPYETEEQIGWKLEKLETVVVDSETGEIIGRDTKYRRTVNIAEGSGRLYWGLAQTTCEGEIPKDPLYKYVLIPTQH
jgi:hypothetical protein